MKTTAIFRRQLYLPRRGRPAISPQNREIKSLDQVPALHWWTLKTATKPASNCNWPFCGAEYEQSLSLRCLSGALEPSFSVEHCVVLLYYRGHKKVCIIQPNGGRWYYCMNQSLGAAAVMDAAWSSLFSTGHEAAQGRYQIFLGIKYFYSKYFDVDVVDNRCRILLHCYLQRFWQTIQGF